jgi:hypothetical protein
VDIIGCPRVEDDGTKENAVGQHRADFKADRRGYSAKGVQSGTFARYASLKVGKPDPTHGQFKPRPQELFGQRHQFVRLSNPESSTYPLTFRVSGEI